VFSDFRALMVGVAAGMIGAVLMGICGALFVRRLSTSRSPSQEVTPSILVSAEPKSSEANIGQPQSPPSADQPGG